MTPERGRSAPTDVSVWERGLDHATDYGAYVTLGLGAIFALISPEPGQNRLVTIALVALAASWTFLMFSRAGGRMSPPVRFRIYYVGFMVLAAVLMVHHPFFFIYPVAAFFQAVVLKPAPATFLGVFLASLVVNGLIILDNPSGQNVLIYAVVVAVQTLAIGLGVIGGEKIAEFNEERRRAVVELENALAENEGLHTQLMVQAREAGVSAERQRLAREIHDTIAQGLVGVITQLEAADHVIEDRLALERHIDNALRIARDSLDEARRVVRAEKPAPLEGNSLPEAIEDVVRRWRLDNSAEMEWSVVGTSVALHPEIEVTLLRVVQESLANVARHAAAHRVGVTLSYIGDVVTVDVRDDGKGFEANGGQELGFGLRAMQARVSDLAGTLEIESEPGRGTATSATIPISDGDGDGGGDGETVMAETIRLLLVDDHPVVRDGLRGMFANEEGFEVIGEASDGREAVDKAAALVPDVVLMDLRMPATDGVAAIREIVARQLPARVLVLTTYDTDRDVVAAIEAGATGYLLKDAPREELLRAVEATARGEAVLSPPVGARLMARVRQPEQEKVSEREMEVLRLVAAGSTNREIAEALFVSEATVKTHLLHLFAKLGVNDRAAAVATAFQRGLLTPGGEP